MKKRKIYKRPGDTRVASRRCLDREGSEERKLLRVLEISRIRGGYQM